MKVITFLNEKGGVGKTTLATHVAAGLAIRGYTVMLVDTDPQGHASIALGLNKRPDFYDLTVRNADWRSVTRPVHPDVYGEPHKPPAGKLYAVSSNKETRHVAEGMERSSTIRRRFVQMSELLDYIVVDTSPTPSLLHASIMAATNYAIIPTDCEPFGGLDAVYNTVNHVNDVNAAGAEHGATVCRLIGILPTKYRANTATQQAIYETLQNDFGRVVWEPVPHTIVYADAQMDKQFLFGSAPDHPATAHMWRIVDYVEYAEEVIREQDR